MTQGIVTGLLTSLPGRYAQALFSIAKQDGAVDEVYEQLQQFQALLRESEQLRMAVNSPKFCHSDRIAVCQGVLEQMKLKGTIHKFFMKLVDSGRLQYLDEIIRVYGNLTIDDKKVVPVEIYSAVKLSTKQKTKLESALKTRFGKSLTLRYTIRPGLIGGVAIRSRSQVVDATLLTQFQQLSTSMKGA